MNCIQCHAFNEASDSYCTNCGSKLLSAPAVAAKDNSANILLILIAYIGLETIYYTLVSKVIVPAIYKGDVNRDIEFIYDCSFWVTNVIWIVMSITLAVISKNSNVRIGMIFLSLLGVLRILVYRVFA